VSALLRGGSSSHLSWQRSYSHNPSSTITRPLYALSDDDVYFLQEAVDHAKNGLGHTFPNPAVGCVLVSYETTTDDSDETTTGTIIGAGFHPRAGYPHAEVFALLQAAGHVVDGVEAAQVVVNDATGNGNVDRVLLETVQQLTERYTMATSDCGCNDEGANELFANCLQNKNVTAYVTLEPCCHYGKTPPCAASLRIANANQVVVGFRDPNPRVDGGGVKVLQDANIPVEMVPPSHTVGKACANLVTNFCRRITPREETESNYSHVTGAMRSALRSIAARALKDGTLQDISWGGGSMGSVRTDTNDDGDDASSMEDAVNNLLLSPEWMEHVDGVLWREELILLRLNKAVSKKKGAKLLGQRIASQLQAHVAQTKGHTVLLYRPAIPPVLDLVELVNKPQE